MDLYLYPIAFVLYSLVISVVTYQMLSQQRINIFVAAHFFFFCAYVFVIQAITIASGESNTQDTLPGSFFCSCLLFATYPIFFYFITRRWFQGLSNRALLTIISNDHFISSIIIAIYATLKVILIIFYGVAAFNSGLEGIDRVPLPAFPALINEIVTLLALGAFLKIIFYLASQGVRNLWYMVCCAVFVVFFAMVGGAGLGIKRPVVAAAIIFVCVYRTTLPSHLTLSRLPLRLFVSFAILAGASSLFSMYYEDVRYNWYNTSVYNEFFDERRSVLGAVVDLMTPSEKHDEITNMGLENSIVSRESALYTVALAFPKAIQEGHTLDGALTIQSFWNAVPAFMQSKKEYIDVDEIFAREYGYPDIDYPTSLFSIFISDYGLFGIFISYFMIIAFFITFYHWSLKTNSLMVHMSSLGVVFQCIFAVDASFNTYLCFIRDVGVLWVLASIISFLRLRITRKSMVSQMRLIEDQKRR